jgi:hypothetical protein
MRIGGRHFSPAVIDRIQATIDAEPSLSRRALSLRVCAWLSWHAPNGKPQDVSCRKALLRLNREGLIHLPEPAPSGFTRKQEEHVDFGDLPRIACSLDALGSVEVVPVSSRYVRASAVWNNLMDRFHYLGKGPLCGAQIRYLITCEAYGELGALAFSAATWRLKARDEHIGWSEAARRANLQQVVCNSRFLILPDVKVPNLASHVLSLCTDRLVADWLERYDYEPSLLESFVDPERFLGTCYQAANWRKVGQTAGRPLPYTNGTENTGPKDIYLYPLRRNWQTLLCKEPEIPLGSAAPTGEPNDWVEQEFATVPLYDERLKERLCTLTRDFFTQPGELVPQACQGSEAKIKAAYRFFSNSRVEMQALLRSHTEATLERLRSHAVILAPQDTTTLNYTAHPPEGIGPIGTVEEVVGLMMHDTMAFTTDGTPLGLLDVQCWARAPVALGKKHRRKELPIEQKESIKWLTSFRAVAAVQRLCPDTMVVSVGDREADIHDLFHEAVQAPSGPKLLVRAERSRNRIVDENQYLWNRMADEAVAGIQQVSVPRKASRLARMAKLEVRFATVVLQPPKLSRLPPVEVEAVYAREVEYDATVEQPIDWMLLTTVPTEHFKDACERLTWYSKRWGIEVYHRTVKSGCRIEDRRLDDANSLETCLAIDLVVAWRVYWLTMAGRETPDLSCREFLSEDEWRVLGAWATGETIAEPPTAQQAARWIGKLGGWVARGKDDNPGTTCMWRGLVRLPCMVDGFRIALKTHGIRDGP